LKHALDFSVRIGTKIYAAEDGEVIAVKVDSKYGGPEEKYDHKKYLNYIEIKHKNNEYGEYGHLKYKGAAVKIGQYVKAGDLIGWR
jgi:murein DD-endopeptidase MepM/ murein hydrolase activator NlpD